MRQKPIAQKKLEGTYRKDRDLEREQREAALSEIKVVLPPGSTIRCPKSLKTKAARTFFRQHTAMLIRLQVLAHSDLPQVERLWVIFEKLARVQESLIEADPLTAEFERLRNSYLMFARYFDSLAKNYYISPAARSRLTIDVLNAVKTAQEVRAGEDAIGAILAGRQA